MNLSSSSNCFHIKNLFSIHLFNFKLDLDWASFSVKHRGLAQDILYSMHSKNGRRVQNLESPRTHK
jgi:hypothetical protein